MASTARNARNDKSRTALDIVSHYRGGSGFALRQTDSFGYRVGGLLGDRFDDLPMVETGIPKTHQFRLRTRSAQITHRWHPKSGYK